MSEKRSNVHKHLSVFLFIFACCMSTASFIVPPLGVIDPSILIYVAQVMLFASGLLFGKNFMENTATKILSKLNENIEKHSQK